VTFVTVIFSRLPFVQARWEEQIRLCGDRHAVRVSVALEDCLVHVFGLHLDVYDEAGAMRLSQAQQVLRHCSSQKNVVLAGDLNSLRRRDYSEADWDKLVRHDNQRGQSREKRKKN